MVILETDHFILRQCTLEDIDAYLKFWNDPQVMQFIGDGTWGGGRQKVEEFITKNILGYKPNPGLGSWAVIDKSSAELVGEAGLVAVGGSDEVDAGYILRKDYWGKGYGTELLKGLLRFGFKNLELNKIIAVAHPDNIASARVMQKCGMTYCGLGFYYNRPSVKYAITASEFTSK